MYRGHCHRKGHLAGAKNVRILSPHWTKDTQNSLKITKVTKLPSSISVNPCGWHIAITTMLQKALTTLRNASVAQGVTPSGQFLGDKK